MIETHQVRVNPHFVPESEYIILNASVNAEANKIGNIFLDVEHYQEKPTGIVPINGVKVEPNLPAIMERVLMFYHVSIKDLIGRSRKNPEMKARNIFCAVARQKTRCSLTEIGFMINRDYASVRNACKSIRESERKAINGDTTYKEFQRICHMFKNNHIDE